MILAMALAGGLVGLLAGMGPSRAVDRWVTVSQQTWRAGAALFAWNGSVLLPAAAGPVASMLLWVRFGRGLAGRGLKEILPVTIVGASFYLLLAVTAWSFGRYFVADHEGWASMVLWVLFMVSVPAAATCLLIVPLAARSFVGRNSG